MHKIVVLDGYVLNPGDLSWKPLESLGSVTVYDRTPAEKIVERIADADIILTNKTPITRQTLLDCPSVKYVGALATGFNTIDIAAAKELGVAVTNVPAYSTDAVAQFTMALLLEVCHHVGEHSRGVMAGDWVRSIDFCYWQYPQIELAGKTMGILGFGRIGQATGRIAKALGMRILAFDTSPNDSGREIAEYVSLDTLLAESDVISVHCPLFEDTRGIICKANIDKMKDGVILLNNSRGPLVVEQDLADALNSGKVYAAGLDVVAIEPIQPDNPLLSAKNCIITPHISWASKESRQRLLDIAVDNLRQFLNGTPINTVHAH